MLAPEFTGGISLVAAFSEMWPVSAPGDAERASSFPAEDVAVYVSSRRE
jgi:hypothetical protein